MKSKKSVKKKYSYLMLENLDIYLGARYKAKVNFIGKIGFNISITGYQEVITDPSYKGQIILFTHPHIGNVGNFKEIGKVYSQVYTRIADAKL